MLFRNYILYIVALCTLSCSLPAYSSGFIKVRNFPKEAYSGGAQNWAFVQDSVGKIYIGNRDGLLLFDGNRWKKYVLPNYTTVRSLLYDSSTERIYAGGSEELGYFTPDEKTGELKYTSILNLFPQHSPPFTEIWNIFKTPQGIWFQADNHLFCFNRDNVRIFPVNGRISTSSLIGSTIYFALEDGRIYTLENGNISEIRNPSPLLEGKKIVSLMPLGRSTDLLVGTAFDGLFRYNGEYVTTYTSPINDFLKENQLFCGQCSDDDLIFGTVNHGAVTFNLIDGSIHYINKETGAQNNTVLKAAFDRMGNIWLCLDNGLDHAAYKSPVNILISKAHSIGAGYCSHLIGKKIFFGTNQGLFSCDYPYAPSPTPASLHRELSGQVWSITESPHGLFMATDAGIFNFSDGNFIPVSSQGTYKVLPVPGKSDLALASTYDHFHLLRYDGKRWIDAGNIEGFSEINGNFVFGPDGCVWIPHWRRGVYRLRFDADAKKFTNTRLFSASDGFPSDQNNTVCVFDGRIVFSTEHGFYKLDETAERMIVRDNELNGAFYNEHDGIVQTLPDGSLSIVDFSGIYIASKRADGEVVGRRIITGNISDQLIPGFTNLNYIAPDELIISTQDGFTSVNPHSRPEALWSAEPMISAVYANRDSTLFMSFPSGRQLSDEAFTIPADLNSLRFEFSYPDFVFGEDSEFSSYLENYESDWTPFTHEASREYTRLQEGSYTMHLRVRDNATGEIRHASIGFKVTPPWFRSPLARLLYALSVLILIALCVGALKKWIEKSRQQLVRRKEREMQELRSKTEQEALLKDYEIASLKTEQLEQDIKHKSQELSTTAMNLIHKNEMLTEIASQIDSLQQLAASDHSKATLQKQLAKMKASIEQSISRDNDWNAFNKNFDIVYGDYTKRLEEHHPTLSSADKRLCCYIRMGLSSKEIAPLINISYKSVEMARYRLRKKISLPGGVSLTDYLTNL